ncbi:MAG: glycosyltransferase family 39 protein [Candidatus Omnitrophica bacterium]|jgi:hypothetical protein|nr:glycosyltransferase family 39 protein [Candidatus Omnitrophota bacterium]
MYLQNNFWIKNITIPALLILPVLLFAVPAIPQGVGNIEMIRHFDPDEVLLVEFAGKIYSKGLTPFEYAYPQFFYYLGGIFLGPYTFLKGLNYQIVTIILRSLNLLAVLSTIVLLYFFCLRFFKSMAIAILSCIILITTPEYLWWIVNCRPHPLEIFFILLTFYFCFQLIEKYQLKVFLKAVISAGLAASVKYGGIFMVPVLWAAFMFSTKGLSLQKLTEYIKSKYKLISFITKIIFISVSLTIISITIFFITHQGLFHRTKIKGLADFLQIRNIRILIALVTIIIIGNFIWMYINKVCKKLYPDQAINKKYRYLFIINKSLLIIFYIVASMLLIFLVFNPTYWIFPQTTAKSLIRHFTLTTMGTNVDLGLNSAIFDFNRLIWLKMFFDNNLLGINIGILLGCYVLYEIIFLRRNWKNDRTLMLQRSIFWIYITFFMFILFLLITHRPHHYLLPIAMISGILTSFGIVEVSRKAKSKFFRLSWIFLSSFLLATGISARIPEIVFNHWALTDKEKDTGLIVGKWLSDNYDSSILIFKDSEEFYIPPKFNNVYFRENNSDINELFKQIAVINPDILVITNENYFYFTNIKMIDKAIKEDILTRFKKIKTFDYFGPLALGRGRYGKYKQIYIYSKIK